MDFGSIFVSSNKKKSTPSGSTASSASKSPPASIFSVSTFGIYPKPATVANHSIAAVNPTANNRTASTSTVSAVANPSIAAVNPTANNCTASTVSAAAVTAQVEHNEHLRYLRQEFARPNPTGTRRGHCAIMGCRCPNFQLEGRGSHRCRSCRIVIHHLCALDNGFVNANDDRKMYCSTACMTP